MDKTQTQPARTWTAEYIDEDQQWGIRETWSTRGSLGGELVAVGMTESDARLAADAVNGALIARK